MCARKISIKLLTLDCDYFLKQVKIFLYKYKAIRRHFLNRLINIIYTIYSLNSVYYVYYTCISHLNKRKERESEWMEKYREKAKEEGKKDKRKRPREIEWEKERRYETEGNEGWDGFRRTWELSTKRAVKRSLESTGTVRYIRSYRQLMDVQLTWRASAIGSPSNGDKLS